MINAAGYLLAGGQSTRMGRDKALLELNGVPLAELALAKLRSVCTDVAIAGGAGQLNRFALVIPDSTPGCGPLGGLVAALEHSRHDWNLFLPVDVPLVPVAALRTLLKAAGEAPPSTVAVLAQAGGRVHPLCGVYSRRALQALRAELAAGRLKVMRAVECAGSVVCVTFEEAAWFRNANTPEEFDRLSSEKAGGA